MPIKYILDSNDKIDFGTVGLKNATGQSKKSVRVKTTEDGLEFFEAEDKANKDVANGYPGLSAGLKIAGSQITYGTGANTACEGNDPRLSDARTPTAHAPTHERGGSDIVKASRLYSGLDASKPGTGNTEGDIWWATDTDKLYIWDGAAWKDITGGGGAVTSVFGRTGAVVAQTNDYTWAQIDKATSSLADITTRLFTQLTDVPSSYSGQARKLVNAGATALEFLNELDSLTLNGLLTAKGDVQIDPQGTADATNQTYDSYNLKLISSSWRSGAEVKRTWTVRNIAHTSTDYLQFYAPDGTIAFIIERPTTRTNFIVQDPAETRQYFRINGLDKFYYVVDANQVIFSGAVPLRFYGGPGAERLRLDTDGSTFYGDVLSPLLKTPKIKDVDATPVDDVLLKVIDGLLKIRNSADTANVRLEKGFLPSDTEYTANKDQANGYAGLDASSKISSAQLPVNSRVDAYRLTDQDITAGQTEKIQLSSESYDNLGEFDNTTNYRFTAQAAGGYLFTFNGSGGSGYLKLRLRKNGGETSPITVTPLVTGAAGGAVGSGSVVLMLAANDYVELWANNEDGGSPRTLSTARLTVTRLW